MQKKILIIATDFPPRLGGVATYSWELAESFTNAGHEITVLTRESDSTPSANFNIVKVQLPKSGLLAILPLSLQIRKLLKQKAYDHVFCPLWLPGASAYWLARLAIDSAPPYSVAVHAMEIVNSKTSFKKAIRAKLQPLKARVFRDAQNIFCVSDFSKNLLLEQFPKQEKNTYVVNNGVNPKKFFKADKQEKFPYPSLVTACRLMPHKGIDQVLRVLPKLKNKYPSLKYHIVGDGPDRKRLENLSHSLNLREQVTFLGSLPQDQMLGIIQRSHLFVMLSRQLSHHVEGFGLVFLEAAMSAVPSLGGKSGGIPDAIDEGVTGWLVDPYDLNQIETKILAILESPQILSQIGRQAEEKTKSQRTWDHSAKLILSHFEGLNQ